MLVSLDGDSLDGFLVPTWLGRSSDPLPVGGRDMFILCIKKKK